MKEFKPIKELVKALTYIGDAIAGTNKSSNSQDESNDVYDGILEIADGFNTIRFSFGIKDNDNATRLGDLFTDNFINDFNSANGNIDFVSTVTKLNDEKIKLRISPPGPEPEIATIYKDGSVFFMYGNDDDNNVILTIKIYDKNYVYITTLLNDELTKDTPLQKINNDEQEA